MFKIFRKPTYELVPPRRLDKIKEVAHNWRPKQDTEVDELLDLLKSIVEVRNPLMYKKQLDSFKSYGLNEICNYNNPLSKLVLLCYDGYDKERTIKILDALRRVLTKDIATVNYQINSVINNRLTAWKMIITSSKDAYQESSIVKSGKKVIRPTDIVPIKFSHSFIRTQKKMCLEIEKEKDTINKISKFKKLNFIIQEEYDRIYNSSTVQQRQNVSQPCNNNTYYIIQSYRKNSPEPATILTPQQKFKNYIDDYKTNQIDFSGDGESLSYCRRILALEVKLTNLKSQQEVVNDIITGLPSEYFHPISPQ